MLGKKYNVHLIQNCQFTNQIVSFLNDEKYPNNLFIVPGKGLDLELIKDNRILNYDSKVVSIFVIIYLFFRAERIILHGFFYYSILIFFIPFCWLRKKVIWIAWGGDIYLKNISLLKRWIRNSVIPNIALLVGDIKGDLDIAKDNYKLSDEVLYSSFVYPNKLVDRLDHVTSKKKQIKRFLISHSATNENRHIESIKLIEDKGFTFTYEVFLPMSYGDFEYRIEVVKFIQDNHLSSKYYVQTEFIELNEYLSFLSTIDVALFMSNRQIGMNNLIPLLYHGAKVFISEKSSSWDYFSEMGLRLFNITDFNMDTISEDYDSIKNRIILEKYFNKSNLSTQWDFILSLKIK